MNPEWRKDMPQEGQYVCWASRQGRSIIGIEYPPSVSRAEKVVFHSWREYGVRSYTLAHWLRHAQTLGDVYYYGPLPDPPPVAANERSSDGT